METGYDKPISLKQKESFESNFGRFFYGQKALTTKYIS